MTPDKHLTTQADALAHHIAALLAGLKPRSLSANGRRVLEDAWKRIEGFDAPSAAVRAETAEVKNG